MDQLASVFADANDLPRLASIVRQLDQLDPNSEAAVYYSAALPFMSGHANDAIRIINRLRPATGRVLNLLGAAYAATGRAEEADRSLTHASRMAVMGELTTMVAHEVRQPLTAIPARRSDAASYSIPPPPSEERSLLASTRQRALTAAVRTPRGAASPAVSASAAHKCSDRAYRMRVRRTSSATGCRASGARSRGSQEAVPTRCGHGQPRRGWQLNLPTSSSAVASSVRKSAR
jgi:hypothetical protein